MHPILEKAKAINPDYLQNYSELGRVYSLLGRYEDAEREFTSALHEEKYPNFRHKLNTLIYEAENFRRWAGSFRARGDYANQVQHLEKAYITINRSREIYLVQMQTRVFKNFRLICLDLGIALGYQQNNKYALYLEEAITNIHLENNENKPTREIVASACYYLALFGSRNGIPTGSVQKYLERAQGACDEKAELFEKIEKLKKNKQNGSKNEGILPNRLGEPFKETLVDKLTFTDEQVSVNAGTPSNPTELVGKHEIGTVKWFSARKGYGFILRDNGQEIFCHFSNIVAEGFKSIHPNRKVEYDIGLRENEGQVEAKNVRELPSE